MNGLSDTGCLSWYIRATLDARIPIGKIISTQKSTVKKSYLFVLRAFFSRSSRPVFFRLTLNPRYREREKKNCKWNSYGSYAKRRIRLAIFLASCTQIEERGRKHREIYSKWNAKRYICCCCCFLFDVKSQYWRRSSTTIFFLIRKRQVNWVVIYLRYFVPFSRFAFYEFAQSHSWWMSFILSAIDIPIDTVQASRKYALTNRINYSLTELHSHQANRHLISIATTIFETNGCVHRESTTRIMIAFPASPQSGALHTHMNWICVFYDFPLLPSISLHHCRRGF